MNQREEEEKNYKKIDNNHAFNTDVEQKIIMSKIISKRDPMSIFFLRKTSVKILSGSLSSTYSAYIHITFSNFSFATKQTYETVNDNEFLGLSTGNNSLTLSKWHGSASTNHLSLNIMMKFFKHNF
jgi:hypothetical protein